LSFAAAVAFINFIRIHGAEGFHFRFFSDSKLPRMEKIFRDLGADFRVELYRPPVSWTQLWGSRAIAYFSPLVLAKFEGFKLLSTFPNVVWLDYDIVIEKPLAELWNRRDFDLAFMGSGQAMAKGFIAPPTDVDLEREGMSAGVMVLRSSFVNHVKVASDLYGIYSKTYASLYYPEQAVFDLYFLSNQDFVYWKLDERFCAFPGRESANNLITHSFGPKKFWNGLQNDSWSSYYEEWLNLGGWSWNPLQTKLAKLLRGLKHLTARFLMLFRFGHIRKI
jgi:lipopolysaccharide biosynthesis glycosyltransferase